MDREATARLLRALTLASLPLVGAAIDPGCKDPICLAAQEELNYSIDYVEIRPLEPRLELPVAAATTAEFRREHVLGAPYAKLGDADTWPLRGDRVIAPFDGDNAVLFSIDRVYAQRDHLLLFLATTQRPGWMTEEEEAEGGQGVIRALQRNGRDPIEVLSYALVYPDPGILELTLDRARVLAEHLAAVE